MRSAVVERPCDRLAGVLEHWEKDGEAVPNGTTAARHVHNQTAAQHACNAAREDRRAFRPRLSARRASLRATQGR